MDKTRGPCCSATRGFLFLCGADTYVWEAYDNMWPDFMPDYMDQLRKKRGILPAFGMAAGKYFLNNPVGLTIPIIKK
ncbi:MAG: hypothetical protein R2764_21195 [Bacteroidales bacterium]